MGIQAGAIGFDSASTLTISSGAVTITQSVHFISSETGTSDDLDTVNIGVITPDMANQTMIFYIQAASGHTITVKNGTGNINLNGGVDFTLSGDKTLALFYDGTNISDTGAGGGGGGASQLSDLSDVSSAATTAIYVLATPDGTSGNYSGRALVVNDLPTVSIAKGGTGQTTATAGFDALAPATTKGDLIVYNGTDNVRLAVGTDGYVLTADSTETTGTKWTAASSGGIGAADYYEADEASDYSTTSTTFVDVDATNFSFTVSTTSADQKVLVGFVGSVTNNGNLYFDIDLDGTRVGGDDGVMVLVPALYNYGKNASFTRMVNVSTSGSHTFKLQWKVEANTGTMYAGAGTSGYDIHPEFWVQVL